MKSKLLSRVMLVLLLGGCQVLLLGGCQGGSPYDTCPTGWGRLVGALQGTPAARCPDEPIPPASLGGVGAGPVCPLSGGADPCAACLSTYCCKDVSACTDDAACEALLTCRAGGGATDGCAASYAASGAPFANAEGCITSYCAEQCGRLL